jgi:hypothetical protein
VDWHVDGSTVANAFGITERRVQQLCSKKPAFEVCKVGRGIYDFYKFAGAYAEYQRNIGESERGDGEDDFDPRRERARKDFEAADKLALENQQSRKELIKTADVVEFMAHVQVIYNTQFENFKGRLTSRLVTATNVPAADILAIVQPEIHLARDITAKELEDYGESLKDEN